MAHSLASGPPQGQMVVSRLSASRATIIPAKSGEISKDHDWHHCRDDSQVQYRMHPIKTEIATTRSPSSTIGRRPRGASCYPLLHGTFCSTTIFRCHFLGPFRSRKLLSAASMLASLDVCYRPILSTFPALSADIHRPSSQESHKGNVPGANSVRTGSGH